MVEIWLGDSDLILARLVADKRNEMNLARGDAPAYALNSERMEDNSVAMFASTRCEMAVAKHYNRYWHASWWAASDHGQHKHEPDVGHNIEVKRIRKRENPLLVKEQYAKENRHIVLAYAHSNPVNLVEVIGWITAAEAWRIGEPAPWDKSGRLRSVPQSMLNAP